MENELNTDAEREQIVFGESVDWDNQSGGIKRFYSLPPSRSKALLDGGYVDPDQRQNGSPTAEQFVLFADAYGGLLDGYVVSPERHDARVSFDCITLPADVADAEAITEFISVFKHADEFRVSNTEGCYAWFD